MGAPNGGRSARLSEEGISQRSAGAASATNARCPSPSSILKPRVEVESNPGMPALAALIAVQLAGTFRLAGPSVTVRDASAASRVGDRSARATPQPTSAAATMHANASAGTSRKRSDGRSGGDWPRSR
jgi:hypothetical protein